MYPWKSKDQLKIQTYDFVGDLYPFQHHGALFLAKVKRCLLTDKTGLGKLQSNHTLILTPYGWKTIGELKVGECVIGSNGQPTKIIGVFPQGIKPSYKVIFSDHSSVEAGPEHLWTARYLCGGRQWKDLILTTDQIRTRPKIKLKHKSVQRASTLLDLSKTPLRIPMLTSPVFFERVNSLPIPPYLMGALISNGTLGCGTVLTTHKDDSAHVISGVPKEFLGVVQIRNNTFRCGIIGVASIIRDLKLNVRSRQKFIPQIYLRSSAKERIQLLYGLMDGDGSITPTRNRVVYHTISLRLAKDVQELIEQLGGVASIRSYDRTHQDKSIEYQVRIRMPEGIPPFSLPRKLNRYKPISCQAYASRTFKEVKYVGSFESTCISVEAKDNLYVTEHCILTHNTIQLIAAYDILKHKYPELQVIICTVNSVQDQWRKEFNRFLPSTRVKPVLGTPKARKKIYKEFYDQEVDCIIVNYSQLLRDVAQKNKKANSNWSFTGPLSLAIGQGEKKFMLVFDEIQKCKNVSTKTAKMAKYLSDRAYAVKGLTATPIHNKLVDLYGIFKVIESKIFRTKEKFKEKFCILDYSWSIYGQIVGYKNHDMLQKMVDPNTFGRKKSEVEQQLPTFITKDHYVELPSFHREVYNLIEDKVDLETGETKSIIGSLVDAQVCANNLEKVKGYEGKASHPKLDEAVRILEEELEGELTLVFTRFVKTVKILKKKLEDLDINVYTIMGEQDLKSRLNHIKHWERSADTSVLIITTAGGEGLNLQQAQNLILIDRPWSLGQLDQIRGRIHRIGSHHASLLEINLVATNTIDSYVLDALKSKAEDSEKVFGESDKPISVHDILERRRKWRNSLKGSKKNSKIARSA